MSKIEIIQSFYKLMAEKKMEDAFLLIDENAVWHSDPIHAAWSGIHYGKEKIRQHFLAIKSETTEFSRKIDEFIEFKDKVIEIGSLHCRLIKTNNLFDTDYVCIYQFKAEKIVYYRIYEDSLKLYNAYYNEVQDENSK